MKLYSVEYKTCLGTQQEFGKTLLRLEKECQKNNLLRIAVSQLI